jgi:hypothetical protein
MKMFFLSMGVIAIFAWIAGAIFHLGYLDAVGFCFGAILVHGVVARIKGKRPGGFENPRPRQDPSEDA